MAPYLIFVLLQKSTHSVNMVLYSQNARLCRNCALIRPIIESPTFVTFHAYPSAHNKLENVGPTFSSLESKMAPSNEGEHGGKRDNSGRKKAPR